MRENTQHAALSCPHTHDSTRVHIHNKHACRTVMSTHPLQHTCAHTPSWFLRTAPCFSHRLAIIITGKYGMFWTILCVALDNKHAVH